MRARVELLRREHLCRRRDERRLREPLRVDRRHDGPVDAVRQGEVPRGGSGGVVEDHVVAGLQRLDGRLGDRETERRDRRHRQRVRDDEALEPEAVTKLAGDDLVGEAGGHPREPGHPRVRDHDRRDTRLDRRLEGRQRHPLERRPRQRRRRAVVGVAARPPETGEVLGDGQHLSLHEPAQVSDAVGGDDRHRAAEGAEPVGIGLSGEDGPTVDVEHRGEVDVHPGTRHLRADRAGERPDLARGHRGAHLARPGHVADELGHPLDATPLLVGHDEEPEVVGDDPAEGCEPGAEISRRRGAEQDDAAKRLTGLGRDRRHVALVGRNHDRLSGEARQRPRGEHGRDGARAPPRRRRAQRAGGARRSCLASGETGDRASHVPARADQRGTAGARRGERGEDHRRDRAPAPRHLARAATRPPGTQRSAPTARFERRSVAHRHVVAHQSGPDRPAEGAGPSLTPGSARQAPGPRHDVPRDRRPPVAGRSAGAWQGGAGLRS